MRLSTDPPGSRRRQGDAAPARLRAAFEEHLRPRLETFLGSHAAAGLAVAVVRDDDVVAEGFGVRDVGTGAPVTSGTVFHLASVSKPVVATAVVSLATGRAARAAALDLDAPITAWVPELTLADGRQAEVSLRHLLSHSSGLPDVDDYGWHDPQFGDDALSDFARSLSGWRLQAGPGSAFAYSNAGFELVGLALSRATGTTFEDAVRQLVLAPLGMRRSTFLRAEVDPLHAASPHVGMPLSVPEGAYPYTRRHAPSSTLHSTVLDMARWVVAHTAPDGTVAQGGRIDPALVDLLWRPVITVGRPPWEEAAALGWAVGSHRGHRVLSHSGTDPGFTSKLALVPSRRVGVVVLANSNTVPAASIAEVALDVALGHGSSVVGSVPLGNLLPPVVGPVAEALRRSGPAAATAVLRRSAALEPAAFDLDDDVFVDAVWGAIELHRTDEVWPLLRWWNDARPGSSVGWTMSGWAHSVDGRADEARVSLRRALELDPGNLEAARILAATGLDATG